MYIYIDCDVTTNFANLVALVDREEDSMVVDLHLD